MRVRKKLLKLVGLFGLFGVIILCPLSSIARPTILDSTLKKRLQSGEGAIVMRLRPYTVKVGYENSRGQYESLDQFMKEATEPTKMKIWNSQLYYMTPSNLKKEKRLIPDFEKGIFLLVGPPGEYTITRYVAPGSYGMQSKRIFLKVKMESSKVKYVGDVMELSTRNKLFSKRPVFNEVVLTFEPDSFKNEMKSYFPKSVHYLVVEQLQPTKENMGSGETR